ncbi:MAG: efflux RND transporter periplasmic adaptor subunit [Alphaproteobacteria bacterium]|nr:efflux RND transporter periplasmic adaptor subunit [Alphaproteobacteria bacterium]MDI9329878.1 efflux RND transporter periplasmic adaptor subunit [Alphaproteobacteria bacterium]
MVNPSGARVRRASPWVWMLMVALVVSAIWWYPTARDRWLLPKDPDNTARGSVGTSGPGGPGTPRGTPVSVVNAQTLDIRVTVSALGNVAALNTALVRAKVDGELQAIHFAEGQQVAAGALLAQIDPRPYELAMRQAEGQLARDQASWRNAQLDLQRYQELLVKDAIARQQVETQEALVKQLEGTVATDRALVDNARLQLSYTRVTAPISGRLGLKQAELGSLVRASDPAGLVTITQTQPMAVVFAVPDVHVPDIQRKLKAGQALPVQAFDRDLKPLALGRVSATDNAIDASTGTLKIKAILDNLEGTLFPNQFAQVRMQLDVLPQRLAVPSQAIQRGGMGNFVVRVMPDQRVKLVRVRLLGSDGDWQAIAPEGELQAGDALVADGADRLRDGSRVEVVSTLKPALPAPLPTALEPRSAPLRAAKPPPPPLSDPNRPDWMDRLPPDVAAKVQAMSPQERRAFFQRMREQRRQQSQ